LFIPDVSGNGTELALVVSLHGAGGNASHGIDMLRGEAEQHGFCILAPASDAQTWDIIMGAYGPDVKALDASLGQVFESVSIRPQAIAISGFSDGASYALSMGLANGSLFPHIVAFSPGFMSPPETQGKPRIFISHGTEDTVLPIDRCSRTISRRLQRTGYQLTYREFNGPHTVPSDIKREAMRWWLNEQPVSR